MSSHSKGFTTIDINDPPLLIFVPLKFSSTILYTNNCVTLIVLGILKIVYTNNAINRSSFLKKFQTTHRVDDCIATLINEYPSDIKVIT